MNRLKIIIITLLLFVTKSLLSEENNFPFPFYILQDEEVSSFLNLHDMLFDFQDNDIDDKNKKLLINLFDICNENSNLQTLFTLNAVANNTNLRKEFIKYYSNINNVSAFFRLTNFVINETNDNRDGRIKLKNGKFKESINFSLITEKKLLNNRIHTLIPGNNFQIVTKKDNSDDFIALITGGGTNSLSMIYQFKKESGDDLIKRLAESKFYGEKYNNWVVVELPSNEKVISNMNATMAFIGLGCGIDTYSIKTGEIVLFLYSAKYKGTFEISWSANFSQINVFYDNPNFIWSYISELTLLTKIE